MFRWLYKLINLVNQNALFPLSRSTNARTEGSDLNTLFRQHSLLPHLIVCSPAPSHLLPHCSPTPLSLLLPCVQSVGGFARDWTPTSPISSTLFSTPTVSPLPSPPLPPPLEVGRVRALDAADLILRRRLVVCPVPHVAALLLRVVENSQFSIQRDQVNIIVIADPQLGKSSASMEGCDCIEPQWPADELLVKYQYISDFFIALAYFSIPLELIYFVKKSSFFPYRWVLIQFGAFIVLCGATHLINLWTFTMHSKTLAIVMTIAKISTAVVSCATALMLVHIIPDLLSVKTRERVLKNKAEELDREMGLIRTQEETGRHVRMLTHEIRSTLDRHTILRTTLVELGRILGLEECALWMPSRTGLNLHLSHTLRHQIPVGAVVPIHLPIVNEVFNSNQAKQIPHTSPLARIRPLAGRYVPPEVVAVRVPLLHLSNFQINDWPELSAKSYAVMVLMLPPDSARKWHEHELELVEVVADQVAVALSHAAILEESMRARDLLMEQNVALDSARREAEKAIHARNDFLAVMNHEMRTPMNAIIALSSLLLETELTPEQRMMVETVLKSSNLLATLINDVLDLSRLEDGSFELEIGTFNLHAVLNEVINLIRPIAAVKKLSVFLDLSPDLPLCAVGDEKRLMQLILNIVGNAVKFTKDGYISVTASIARPDLMKDPRAHEIYLVAGDGSFYLHVQVKDTGCGFSPQDIPHLFTKFAHARNGTDRNHVGTGLGLAICKRFASLMHGHVWLESDGVGKGCTANFVVRLAGGPSNGLLEKLMPVPGNRDGNFSGNASEFEDGRLDSKPRYLSV